MRLYVATTNAGKLRDFTFAAADCGAKVSLDPLPNLAGVEPPVENGETFEANARLKAAYYSRYAPGEWVLADDSGLEVNALKGRPGVRSARLAEDVGALDTEGGLDSSNNTVLMLEMLEQTDRRCRYRCALALARDGVVTNVAAGMLEGELLTQPEGAKGFGYDPLFFVPALGCTMAQASVEQRLAHSHRGRALRVLLGAL